MNSNFGVRLGSSQCSFDVVPWLVPTHLELLDSVADILLKISLQACVVVRVSALDWVLDSEPGKWKNIKIFYTKNLFFFF